MISACSQTPVSRKRSIDSDAAATFKNHCDDACSLIQRGRVAEALVVIAEHGLFADAAFTRAAFLDLRPIARTPETVKAFVAMGANLAGDDDVDGAATSMLFAAFNGNCCGDVALSDAFILAVVGFADFKVVPPTQCFNLLAAALRADGKWKLSDEVLAVIRERSDNTARWSVASCLMQDMIVPCLLERLPGTTIMLENEDVTTRLPEVFAKHVDGFTNPKALDALVGYCRKTKQGLGFLKDWCREMLPRGQSAWLLKVMKIYGYKLITPEWLDEARKFVPDTNQHACAFHADIVRLMEDVLATKAA